MHIHQHHMQKSSQHQERWCPGQPYKPDPVLPPPVSSCVNWGKCLNFSETHLLNVMSVPIYYEYFCIGGHAALGFHLTCITKLGRFMHVNLKASIHWDRRWSWTVECLLVPKEGRTWREMGRTWEAANLGSICSVSDFLLLTVPLWFVVLHSCIPKLQPDR